jgi:hypothetical protein
MLKDDLVRHAGEQRFTTDHFVSSQVNEQLIDRMAALEGVARRVQPAILRSDDAQQSFLEQRPSFEILFNGSYFITDVHGAGLSAGLTGTCGSELHGP